MDKITAVVLAAGQGKRMNRETAKQYLLLNGKPVLYYSLKAFEESGADDIILVTGRGQEDYCRDNIINPYQLKKVSKIIEGGKERYDSVYKALLAMDDADYVLIHDGARPFVSAQLIETVIKQVKESGACIIGTPVKETIKIVNGEGIITATPDRTALWSAQTPQAFEYASIRTAYDMFYAETDKDKLGITDDAMVYENYLKRPVKMLMGDYNNLKLTTPEDLVQAEELLKTFIVRKK